MAYNFPEEEEKILKFWQENQIFEKLRDKNKKGKPWSFLDGPITANNPMGVHHAWGRTYKDVFQRYHAIKGFDERYQNGFDCQGLWVEVEVEKELGFKTKKDIEAYGIDKFVQKCKERVLKYSGIQTQQSIRLGQWMDWEHSYFTMSDENNYVIWHFLKKCWELGYLYKGRDSVPWCPRCGTAISQHEILTEEYKETTHDSVYVQFPIIGRDNEYLLVWTTTPWTLPANIAVAVDKKIEYALVEEVGGKFWVAKDLVERIFEEDHKIIKTVRGEKLVGLKYTWAFDVFPRVKAVAEKNLNKFHIVVATDDRIMPINIEEGTGLVHTAVSAGAEDFQLGKKLGLPFIEIIDEQAVYLDGLGEFSGDNAKQRPEIILDFLLPKSNEKNLWRFRVIPYKHRYPTCWRCKTELVWRVVDEWYIAMDKPSQVQSSKFKAQSLREQLIEVAKKISWIPAFGLERELDWLNNMHDWLISKKRYWGLALPIFECKECGTFEVIGSKEELKKRAVKGWQEFSTKGGSASGGEGNSPHRPWVDKVKIKCKKCKILVSRIKDVGNPWLDAGIVPYSTMNYLSDKKYWKKWFPAEIVCESFPGQFKNWFYSLLVMSAVLENTEPIKTIFGYALVKDEKGEEMHKSKGNAIWFDDAVAKVGADPIRWYYMKANPAENVNFGHTLVNEIKRKLLVLHNVYTFFATYVDKKDFPASAGAWTGKAPKRNVLDRWIVSKMSHLISLAEFNLDKYDTQKTTLAIEEFCINDLSLWYTRRSRKRFNENNADRKEAIETLYTVLLNTAVLVAPAMPFFAEAMYQGLKTSDMSESIHLFGWPENKYETDMDLEEQMDQAREMVKLALAERAAKAIKVRQPLAKLKVKGSKFKVLEKELLDVVKDEINVKEIVFDDKIEEDIVLDTEISKGLMEEGVVREMIRFAQQKRKEGGLSPKDTVVFEISAPKETIAILEKQKDLLTKEMRAKSITFTESKEIVINIKK